MPTDLELLDRILSDVRYRSTVYEWEILTPLQALRDPDVSFYILALSLHTCVVPSDGARLLHSREFLDCLLDCRLMLTAKRDAAKEAHVVR